MGKNGKNHVALRREQLEKKRTTKMARMTHPGGQSAYAKKMRANSGRSLMWLKPEPTSTPVPDPPRVIRTYRPARSLFDPPLSPRSSMFWW